jgi:uncharacterized repeat protein (TIGR01451 family)
VSVSFVRALVVAGMILSAPVAARAQASAKLAPGLRESLAGGAAREVLVEFDSAAIDAELAAARVRARLTFDDDALRARRAQGYGTLKRRAFELIGTIDLDVLYDYSHLPMVHARVRSLAALERLAASVDVKAVYADGVIYPVLDSASEALIGQPAAASLGFTGAGSTVLVIDTGVNYTLADFGSCTSPGTPSGCKVVFYTNNADSSMNLDSVGHGTNVSGIVVGVAPGASIAMWNVFGATGSTNDSRVLQAINWGIANQSTYNIRAINMSVGDGNRYTSPCTAGNPYVSAIANAQANGMLSVASAGNNGFTDGIGKPACTPGAISVGAVYSTSFGGIQWSTCTDSTTAADQITCFSNSASFLSMLAPGALITAGGFTFGGTSQAAPFVTASAAILRVEYPADTLAQTVSRLTATGHVITDARNGISTPRLDLGQAVRPLDDEFVNRTTLSGTSGTAAATSVNATKEPGEPNHAGSAGGASVWWRWTAPGAGQVSVDTHGSGFDTLLAVYTGTSVSTLSAVAANDNDGSAGGTSSLLFEALAGQEYEIAVDSASGVGGAVVLHWSLNASAQADLSLQLSGPTSAAEGTQATYVATIGNNGPQTATNVRLSDVLPAGVQLQSASPGCTLSSASVACTIAALASGTFTSLQWSVVPSQTGAMTYTAVVSSDLPDPASANNSAAVTTDVTSGGGGGTGGTDSNDVPTLPEWGTIVLGALLLIVMAHARARRQRAASFAPVPSRKPGGRRPNTP